MTFKRRIRQPVEAALVALAAWVIPCLPRRVVVALARGFGWLAYLFAGSLRRLSLANLSLAFGDQLDAAGRRRIARESFASFALVVLDLFWFSRNAGERIRRHMVFDESGPQYFDPGAVVALTAHFGNWEVMGLGAALRGAPCNSIAAPLKNPAVDRQLRKMRMITGQAVSSKYGAVRAMLGVLRSGGRCALLVDQNTLPKDGGVFTEFFGLPVPVTRAPILLAEKTGARLVMALCLADRNGNYTASMELIPYEGEQTTAAISRALERRIRKDPGAWLWSYKRWKYIPPGAPAERYPYYARAVDG